MEEKRQIYIVSLGCPKNLIDTEYIIGTFHSKGFGLTKEPELADILIVNTCAFIQPAVEESIEEILSLSNVTKKGARILVTGCLVERYGPDILSKLLPEVDEFIPIRNQINILYCILSNMREIPSITQKRFITTYPKAYIKLAEGCNRRCSFCLIPTIRGPFRLYRFTDIKKEVQLLAKIGIKEIILVAQDLTAIMQKHEKAFFSLLKELEEIDEIAWIRLLYLHPDYFPQNLIKVIADSSKILPYFDLPFQHVNERILKLMGRKGNREKYSDLIRNIRMYLPHATIRSTFLVGFPGETEAEFQMIIDFLKEMEIDHVGSFIFFPEEGIKAKNLPNQVPERIKKERQKRLMETQKSISLQKNRLFIGQKLDILIEEIYQEYAIGRIYSQAPDIDGITKITSPCSSLRIGDLLKGKIMDTEGSYDLVASILE